MNRQGHLNNTQHGFRSGRSCLSALLDVFDDLMHMISSDTTIDMIYLDFQRPLTRWIMVTVNVAHASFASGIAAGVLLSCLWVVRCDD